MLTVNFDRLKLKEGHMVLDLGCGFGRHAFEVLRRGAKVVACDMALPPLRLLAMLLAYLFKTTRLIG